MGYFAGYHIGFGMILIGMVFAIIAVASLAWSYDEVDIGFYSTAKISIGLFRVCVEYNGNEEKCDDYSDPHDKLQATRGLATSGMICIMIAAGMVAFHMFLFYKDRSTMPSTLTLKLCIGFAWFAALINTIANIIYGDYYDSDDSDYPNADISYSYVFLIISSILASVGSIVAYKGRPTRIESGTIITTSNGGTTVAVITTGSHHNAGIVNHAYPPPPPPYGYPPYQKPPPYDAAAYPNPAYPNPAYPGPTYSDPAYPPPQPATYQPPR